MSENQDSHYNEPREPNLAMYGYGRIINEAQIISALERMGGVRLDPDAVEKKEQRKRNGFGLGRE